MDETWSDVLGGSEVRLCVRDVRGPSELEPPLLLMHGLASTQRIWDLSIPRLARRRRVVTYDARGHGLSGKPASGYRFGPLVDDAVAVIEATHLAKPLVVGHSWGAMVALELAARRPLLVSGIVLVDGGVFRMREDFDIWQDARSKLAPPHLAGTPLPDFKRMIRGFFPEDLDVTPEVEQIVLSVMRVGSDGTIRPRLSRANHLRILRAIWDQDPASIYGRLRVPALAILARGKGEREGFMDAKRRAAERLRGSGSQIRVAWMTGIHDLPLQHPEALARRIERFADGVGG